VEIPIALTPAAIKRTEVQMLAARAMCFIGTNVGRTPARTASGFHAPCLLLSPRLTNIFSVRFATGASKIAGAGEI